VLGIDTSCGGYGNFRTAPRWNLDASVSKDIRLASENVGMSLIFLFTNVLNHNVLSDPTLSLTSPSSFGRITTQSNIPRNMEFGLRIHF
jgi:hypothetical protein